MEPTNEALAKLAESTRRYRRTERAHEQSRDEVKADVLAALRSGARPTDVVAGSPFTDAYVRRLARDAGIKAASKPRKPAAGE